MQHLLQITEATPLLDCTPDQIKELQTILKQAGLYKGEIDGIAGNETLESLATFKKENYLEYLDVLGPSTVEALKEVTGDTYRDEAKDDDSPAIVPAGRFMTLPDGSKVFENQLIPGAHFFTWGEATKSCTRVPASQLVVNNIIRAAKGLEEIRERFDDRAIVVTSWYRPPAVNRAVGGASQSTHILGHGVDFNVVGLSPRQVQQKLDNWHPGGLGYGKTFTHADWRNYRARWNYN